jgi:hypothetical protein
MKYLVYILLFFALACNQAAEQAGYDTLESEPRLQSMKQKDEAPTSEKAIEVKRKLIKRGRLRFEASDLEAKAQEVKQLSLKYRGYLSNEETHSYGDRVEYTYTVRLPSAEFDAFLNDLSNGVDYFDEKNISVDDVTEQFLDVEARLKTKKALEVRYTELLSKARNVTEILEIERELGKVRAEVESMEGRLKYLSDQVAFSTLDISFYKRVGKDSRFGNKFTDSLKMGWNILVSLVLGIVTLWPIVILAILGLWMFRRFRKRK